MVEAARARSQMASSRRLPLKWDSKPLAVGGSEQRLMPWLICRGAPPAAGCVLPVPAIVHRLVSMVTVDALLWGRSPPDLDQLPHQLPTALTSLAPNATRTTSLKGARLGVMWKVGRVVQSLPAVGM